MNKILIVLVSLAFTTAALAQEGVIYINKTLIITVNAKVEDVNNIGDLTVKIYDKTNKKVVREQTLAPVPKGEDAIEFTLNLSQELSPAAEYEVRVYSSGILWKALEVKRLNIQFKSSKDYSACKGGIPMFLYGMEKDGDNLQVVTAFWTPILDYLNDDELEKKMIISTSHGETAEKMELGSARWSKKKIDDILKIGETLVCIAPLTKPSSGDFNISVKFVNPPFSLSGEFIGEDLSWGGSAAIKSSNALPGAPDDRPLERNLDLGLSYTSAVKPDSTTHQKKRESHGILDLRFAPILNTIRYRGGPWIRKWTPIFVNANVATGKITESTLSLNRVILGSEFEFRYIPNLKSPSAGTISNTRAGFVDYYRFNISGNHASDRDFKQKEITAKAEFQPVWAFLNRPRDTNWRYVDDKITGNKVVEYGTFGWEIVPLIGFEFGKTYSRQNPAAAITASDFIKRLYGGLEMKFAITSHFSLKLEDTLYGRYELKTDRLKNYFKGEIYAPLSSPFRQTENGLFLSFEKGDAPPFSNTVNVVKFGYRIQSNGWGRF